MPDEFIHQKRIAYFSMEVAFDPTIPTYAGGLGILAGDTVRSAADLNLPLVTVTLVSRAGYFIQALDSRGHQTEMGDFWEPKACTRSLAARVRITLEGRPVWIGAWLAVVQSPLGGRQPVVLLDTDLAENAEQDRSLTDSLYGGEEVYRLKQEMVLGVGGTRMLNALGFKVQDYHMNEGHAAPLVLELLNRNAYPEEDLRPGEPKYDVPRVREQCIFTTHTPVEAGHDRFPYPLVRRVLDDFIDEETLRRFGGDDDLNMTSLALNLSERVNGVAKRHAETSRKLFPGYHVGSITNGVHPRTWTSPAFAKLYDARLPGWSHEPEMLVRADCCIPPQDIWEAHVTAKQALLQEVSRISGKSLALELPLIGYARRMTAYKRPELLFTDLARLAAIAEKHPFQVVLAGKAHPKDASGKELIRQLFQHMEALQGKLPVVFLPNYDMRLAQYLVAGVDIWLNTPMPPLEASGTSGMKAAFNGVPSLSVLDGWWLEGCIEGVTGWAIGDGKSGPASDDDALELYDKLEQVVLPLYQDRARFIEVMRGAIAKNASYFNSHRMMRRYASDAYLR